MDYRYPIGPFAHEGAVAPEQRELWIREIEKLPAKLRLAVEGLSEEQLDTPYRDGGWTVRQVVHHVADSHMNSLTRFKLALTEERPTIKPYAEERWAELADAKTAPIEISLHLLEALHERWVLLLESLTEAEYARAFYHPESGETVALDWNLGFYAWHGNHHAAHITTLRARKGW
ncbi:YfiT family bacillithiol transferase [Paenibacillus methanolicus]|uniref:Putative metal-dependent hydrolase BCM02_11158 n=1 Tax=Paenibacillus methanolicus TaxID=582686 RepID=A0A5S5BY34_9BACL|nr:bacillithiol transferase BstA [Paenibacillus methanolicus]TYP70553.1 DinB family protein [Paenibacillus methanolicus]